MIFWGQLDWVSALGDPGFDRRKANSPSHPANPSRLYSSYPYFNGFGSRNDGMHGNGDVGGGGMSRDAPVQNNIPKQ